MHFSHLGHSGAEWLCLCIYSLSLLLHLLTSALGRPWYVVGGMESSLNGGGWGAGSTHGREERRLLSTWVVSCLEDQLKAAWQEVSISGH